MLGVSDKTGDVGSVLPELQACGACHVGASLSRTPHGRRRETIKISNSVEPQYLWLRKRVTANGHRLAAVTLISQLVHRTTLGVPLTPLLVRLLGISSEADIRSEMKAELRRALTAPPERHAVGLTCRKATAGWVGRVVRTCCLSHFVSEIALNSEGCLLAQPSTACVSS